MAKEPGLLLEKDIDATEKDRTGIVVALPFL
jgi:hypothetical protein